MKLFDKMKEIWNKITGKETKSLPDISIEDKQEDTIRTASSFKDEIAFDQNDVLDPRVCRGDKFITNILKSLNANDKILENPVAMREIEKVFTKITEKHDINMNEPTADEIDEVVKAIKESEKKYIEKNPQYEQYAIGIDEKTGEITLYDKPGHVAGSTNDGPYSERKTKFSIEQDKLNKDSWTYKESNAEGAFYNHSMEEFDKDGFDLKKEIVSYNPEAYYSGKQAEEYYDEGYYIDTYTETRNKENPMIASNNQGYYIMDPKNINRFGFSAIGEKDGQTSSLRFDTLEEAKESFNKNEDELKSQIPSSLKNAGIMQDLFDGNEHSIDE